MKKLISRNAACRVCKRRHLEKVFAFGPTALANAFLRKEQIYQPEYNYPLDVYFCRDCTMLQMVDIVSPEVMFKDYVYVSSTSPVFIAHFESFAQEVTKRFSLNPTSLVIDIGSNDGILLKPFKKLGTRVLGVDPAKPVAAIARRQGIDTIGDFFSVSRAKKIVASYGHADVMTGTNVFAHVNDLDELINGVKHLLKKDGVFIIEVPYLIDFLEKNLFDTVYHEHLSYFAIKPMQRLFRRLGMEVFDVQKVSTHGGSIRVFVKKAAGKHPIQKSVAQFLKREAAARLGSIETYRMFVNNIQKNKADLISLLTKLKLQGKKIAGYGAPGKGTTLLTFFSIGPELLDYIVDDSPQKQGLYTPGKHVPVVPSTMLKKQKPDYLFIIAWNFAEPIMKKNADFRKAGGKFIIPVPRPKIV